MPLIHRTDDLERLLDKCRRSDATAWGALVDQFQALVYSIPRRYGLNDDDGADVFQATFQALHRSLDRIESAQTLPKWLSVTASRECLRLKRIASRTVSADGPGLSLDEIVADEEASAEANAIEAERAVIVRTRLRELGGRCEELLSLLYLEGEVAYEDISARLSMPMGAIGPTRARCLEKLRKRLEEAQFFL